MQPQDEARRRLAEMLGRYGSEVLHEPNRCEAFLRDRCPSLPLEINLLVAAAREHVPQQLLDGGGRPSPEANVTWLAQRMTTTRGIAEPLARWAVESWALALGMPVGGTTATTAAARRQSPPTRPPTPTAPPRPRRVRTVAGLLLLLLLVVGGLAGGYAWAHRARPAAVVAADDLDAGLAEQAAARAARAADLDRRATDLRAARDLLAAQVDALDNLATHVSRAIDNAVAEDRWPTQVAGRTVDQAAATTWLARLQRQLDTERRAVETDEKVLGQLADLANVNRAEIAAIAAARAQLHAGVNAEQRRDLAAHLDGYRTRPPPADANLVADPTVPVDVDALGR